MCPRHCSITAERNRRRHSERYIVEPGRLAPYRQAQPSFVDIYMYANR